MKFFKDLITNNNGFSSKSFFLVTVTIIGFILLIIPAVILLIEVIVNKTIQTDLNGLAAYIGAVGVIFTSAGITKAWGDRGSFNNKNESTENNE